MADGGGHAADLAVLAFDQLEREPAIGNVFSETDGRVARWQRGRGIEQASSAGQGGVVADFHASLELRERGGIGNAFHLRPVFAPVRVGWVEELRVQARFVAEEQQAFGVGVEPAERVDVFRQAEFGERAPARPGFGRELRKDTVGFVEGEEHAGRK